MRLCPSCLCREDAASGRCDVITRFARMRSGIVEADPAKEIDIRVRLAGPGYTECYRLRFTVKFVRKHKVPDEPSNSASRIEIYVM